ncbi:hypothetical protein, partial [Neisseria lactamica]|uniref:hypothetical protein n=1 Tax=Neisseria lactamica TaxID=486 RepID=UPI00037B84C6
MPSETLSDRFRRHFHILPPPLWRAFFIKRKISRHSRQTRVIPAQAGIQSVRFQSFPINSC